MLGGAPGAPRARSGVCSRYMWPCARPCALCRSARRRLHGASGSARGPGRRLWRGWAGQGVPLPQSPRVADRPGRPHTSPGPLNPSIVPHKVPSPRRSWTRDRPGVRRRHINCGMCRRLWRESDVSSHERFPPASGARPGAPWCTHAPLSALPRGSMVFRTSDTWRRGGASGGCVESYPHRLSTACGGGDAVVGGVEQCRRGSRARVRFPHAPARRRPVAVG